MITCEFCSLGTYELLRSSGFLKFPHKSTLLKHTASTNMSTGYRYNFIKEFINDIKLSTLREHQKNVSLLFDEIKIKFGLVFSWPTERLVGFTDLGDVNNELYDFNRLIKQGCKKPDLATHVLTLISLGLFKYFNYPVGYYVSVGFDSDQLYPVVWEGVGILEGLGIYVGAFVSDGASQNRKFCRLHECTPKENVSVDDVVYWTWNRFNESEKIFFISDPSHVIKTLRNNLENPHGNHNTRQLILSVFLLIALSFFYCIASVFSCIILFLWSMEFVRLVQFS